MKNKLAAVASGVLLSACLVGCVPSEVREAQEAIDSSNEDEYANAYYALKNANRAFAAYIDEERANSYSAPTNDGDYPFAVSAEEFPQNGQLRPPTKLDSDYPFEIALAEPKTADGLPYLAYFMSDSNGNFNRVYSYNYKIEEIETREINVKDASGEIKRAFVNSQFILSNFSGGNPDAAHAKFQNQSFLLKTANGDLALVIPDLKGEDFYIPYIL